MMKKLASLLLTALSACGPTHTSQHRAVAQDAGAGQLDADSSPETRVGADFLAFRGLAVPDSGILDVPFAVPDAAHGFVLTAESSLSAQIELMGLVGPGPGVLFDAADSHAGPFKPAIHYNFTNAFPLSVLYPSAPSDHFKPGLYVARIGILPDRAPAGPLQVDLDVVWQRVSKAAHLNAAVWLARGASLDAETLTADVTFIQALKDFRDIFESAGIHVAPLQAFDLGDASADLSVIRDDADVDALLAELAKHPADGLDFILVDQIAAQGKTVRGKTISIPGPPARKALTRRGAVVLAIDALLQDPARIGAALAHEAGHYLGLRHTTELDGSATDPIADTPECPIANATFQVTGSSERILSAEDCLDFDGTNLMFPTPPASADTQQTTLTPGQVQVMRGHPLVL